MSFCLFPFISRSSFGNFYHDWRIKCTYVAFDNCEPIHEGSLHGKQAKKVNRVFENRITQPFK